MRWTRWLWLLSFPTLVAASIVGAHIWHYCRTQYRDWRTVVLFLRRL